MKIAVMKKMSPTFTVEEKALMEGLCNAMLSLLTMPYELHMIDFLIDSQNHFGMMSADFQNWESRVLLILFDDDHTFKQPCKDSLIEIMPNPTVVTDILGGHLALPVKLDQYAQTVISFVKASELEK